MSLLTRCPACETLYKLVPDQLRISQGWVRCGQCAEIFDASQHLIEVAMASEKESSGTVKVDSPPIPETEPTEENLAAQQLAEIQPDLQTEVSEVADLEAEAEAEAAAAAVDEPAPEPFELGETGIDQLLRVEATSDGAPTSSLDSEGSSEASALNEAAAEDPTQEHVSDVTVSPADITSAPIARESTLAEVSFLAVADRQSVWRTGFGRVALLFAAVLLAAALLLQWLYWDRDRLAATNPHWKPLLQQLCSPLNCSVRALQRIESIAIDAAAFNQLTADSYRLSFRIKNLSGAVLAMPNLELTLTDTQDKVIVRRVLSRQDMFVVSDDLSAGTELPVTVDMHLTQEEATPRIMGYRLLAFYP